ncbi:autotransporter outer membrane beta-barrel domain-containing protein, partial [Fusobacterium polymorphum]
KTNKEVTKNLNEYIRVAKERAEKGEIPRNQFDQYFYDKKNLTKEAFENKWVKPFKNPDYLKAKENYERELAETRKKMNELEPEYKKAIDDEAIAYDMPNRPSDFYGIVDWPSKTEQQKKAYLNTLTPAGRKYVENWVKAYEKRVKLHAKYFELNALIADGTLAKKYGFWDNPAATAEQKK